jgi:7,8-dihydropterin-6-yl-methyl-4-(beta-D-ribofuranosyl)aminobenzene 5'-phosphate synthase
MQITTLVENDCLEGREELSAGFGLSLHVQFGKLKILFDTGTTGVFMITEIGSAHRRPKGNRRLFVEREGCLVRDPFDHELLMAVCEDDGMVVFTGCSHSGVLNMIEAAERLLPEVPIKAVIGGFHLTGLPQLGTMAASRREVEEIGRQLLARSPHRVYTAHCTGDKGYQVLAGVMGEILEPFHTGSRIEF